MYKNIGKKIKGLVKVLLTISIIFIAIAAIAGIIAVFASGIDAGPAILAAIGILLVAGIWILITWISTWMLYGYGEIIDKVTDIEKKMPVQQPAQSYQQPVPPQNSYQQNTTYQQY
ncbi:MAG: hypothetical protein IJM18_06265 [Clostridia bacterium]|nr:hypothetical protein [Clostridia bacterium]